MKKLLLLALLAVPAQAQEQATPPPNEVAGAGCGEYVKFTVAMVDEQDSSRTEMVTFWEGPITGTHVLERTRLRVQSVAILGAWGTYIVNGYRNNAYTKEFCPPTRILRTRHEYDCRH